MPEPPKVYISRSKQDFLYGQGFKFNLRREIFILRKEKIVMSFEFVAAYDLDIIRRVFNLREKSDDYWTLHFIGKLSPGFRKQLIKAFRDG
jgi:hypothetical protein